MNYVITNRKMDPAIGDVSAFGKIPNERGPNELRVCKIDRLRNGKTRVRVLNDWLRKDEARRINRKWGLDLPEDRRYPASLKVASDVFTRALREKRHLLFYVHGYNNDMGDVLSTVRQLEKLYPVLVVAFSWPADGGGQVSGTLAYKTDKQDARASADALNRAVGKIGEYHALITSRRRNRLMEKAEKEFPENPLAAQGMFSRLLEEDCRVSLNLLCHSMGNYVLKYALIPGAGGSRQLVFDNVALVAADANNPGHSEWVGKIQARKRVCVAINEDDYALAWSRRKPGQAQRERLGHSLKGLKCSNATYFNFTGAPGVGKSHCYFLEEGTPLDRTVYSVFTKIFTGEPAERGLAYETASNTYEVGSTASRLGRPGSLES